LPELPDVEVFRRYLESTALGRRVEDVHTSRERLFSDRSRRTVVRRLRGSGLEKTARHGKNLFVRLSRGCWLLLHFGMTGFLKAYRSQDSAPGHPRLVLDLDDGSHLAYDSQRLLGRISVVESPESYAEREGLGPDALDDDMAPDTFAGLLTGSRAMVKSALMDQGRIAGLGNVYSDEALFHGRIHPRRRAASMSRRELDRLYGTVVRVLRTAIDFGAEPSSAPEDWILPRRREGEECPICGGQLESMKVGGRTAWVCPQCQEPP
jgi:formamidopyrimidine-DNA glycosylase